MTEWLTVKEAASLLNYHPNHVRRLLRKGHIVGYKLSSGYWVISMREVRRVQDHQSPKGRYMPIMGA